MGLIPDLTKPPTEIEVATDAAPLDFLQAVYRNPNVALQLRMKAAIEAAQYVHPRLAVTAVVEGQGFAARLEERLRRIAETKPKVIEVGVGPNTRSG